jgi:hypothetical protein
MAEFLGFANESQERRSTKPAFKSGRDKLRTAIKRALLSQKIVRIFKALAALRRLSHRSVDRF